MTRNVKAEVGRQLNNMSTSANYQSTMYKSAQFCKVGFKRFFCVVVAIKQAPVS